MRPSSVYRRRLRGRAIFCCTEFFLQFTVDLSALVFLVGVVRTLRPLSLTPVGCPCRPPGLWCRLLLAFPPWLSCTWLPCGFLSAPSISSFSLSLPSLLLPSTHSLEGWTFPQWDNGIPSFLPWDSHMRGRVLALSGPKQLSAGTLLTATKSPRDFERLREKQLTSLVFLLSSVAEASISLKLRLLLKMAATSSGRKRNRTFILKLSLSVSSATEQNKSLGFGMGLLVSTFACARLLIAASSCIACKRERWNKQG